MPFQEVSKMHLRKQMVIRIRAGELSVSAAAREYGVARNTVKLWLRRADEVSLGDLKEKSRRPRSSPNATEASIEEAVLQFKRVRPCWGAKKLLVTLWPEGSPISIRTGDRILKRHGLVRVRGQAESVQRFERESPNQLWQIDFKGLGRYNPGYSPLTILDDASRYCIGFDPLENHQPRVILSSLWAAFGEFGLPEAILMDNEPCFAEISRRGPSWLESQLWLLGIRTLHGRPYHPQTQGKVERFHRTVEDELGSELRQNSILEAREIYSRFVHDYNYERPHEALGMRPPGAVYVPSTRSRPTAIPVHEIPSGSISRKTDDRGVFSYRNVSYRVGRGLGCQTVELKEEAEGMAAYFAGRRIELLAALRV
ncbi:MAG: Integrase core domain protein [Armatimonadetes bacterium OLB18]|nr:MAG: Integrase core domain protein [Armatimonadetes bacterium OLB18]